MTHAGVNPFDLLVVGDLNYDYLGRIPFFPRPDEEVAIDPLEGYLGGSGANASVVAARMGLSVAFYSAVGQDASGAGLLELLERSGVSSAHVKRAPGLASGMVFGLIDADGNRRLFCYRGANLALSPADISDADLLAARRLHLNGPAYGLALDLLARSRRLNVPNSVDPGSILIGEHGAEMEALLGQTDVLFVNQVEFANLARGESQLERAAWLHSRGVGWVVLKNGELGSLLFRPGLPPEEMPAYQIRAVDATGAGDAFNAAFLYGLVNRFEVQEMLRLANAVGALAASAVGATSGVPASLDEIKDFMNRTGFSDLSGKVP